MTLTTFAEIALLLAVAAAAGAAALRLRQPLIVALIFVGILVGPSALGWVRSHDEIDLLAQMGVTLLLFVVGLKLDIGLVRHLGPVALATGIGQLVFTIAGGYGLALLLGMAHVKALYVAVALTFSSTIIIVKLLSDKREIDSLHGRIAMGFLIVQDIAVVAAMMAIGSWGGGSTPLGTLAAVALRLAIAAALIAVLMRYVLPPLLARLARSQELLLLTAIAWGVTLAAAGEMVGFSREVGAFVAGFALASTPYREAISARLTSLRDFLLLFFFIDLGAKLDLSLLGAEIGAAAVMSLFVLVGNPLIVMAIMGAMGYRKRTGFLAGLTVAQISEFSIVFIAMGIALGHIDAGALGLVTLVGLVTITLSTYLILHSERLYEFFAPWLGLFERRRPKRELAFEWQRHGEAHPQVIVFGMGRYGSRIATNLLERGNRVLGVDFDPEAVRALRRRGVAVRFGDAEDPQLLDHLPLADARWVVCALPSVEVTRLLLQALSTAGYAGSIAVAVRGDLDDEPLRRLGATHLLHPYRDAAAHAAELVARGLEGTAPRSTGEPPMRSDVASVAAARR